MMESDSVKKHGGFYVILMLMFSVATGIKLLLIPSYRSTDFEVHRNWLAITHSLPLSEWYYEETSEWTLDYPPLFAWFEWFLSLPAAMLDPLIVDIQSLNYATHTCVMYQRLTVVFSDLTLLYGLIQYYHYQTSGSHDQHHHLLATRRSLVASALVLFNYGLFIVDHIHFQYNGFLFGILILSLVRILQGRYLEGGFWFAVLLNLKHIFLYLAPAYFIYLLRHYCFHGNISSLGDFLPWNFIKLGGVVTGVFIVSFGPFIYLGQLGQILSRLFPFKRGLCHAYWAPNAWALYSIADIIIAFVGTRLELLSGSCDASGGCGSMTSGLVGEMKFKVLPQIAPWWTLLITGVAMLPGLVMVGVRTKPRLHDFLNIIVLCAYSSFLFGWHVHEKAVLLIIVPMSLLAVEEIGYTRIFIFLSIAGHISLFPLLHQAAETTVKLSLFSMCISMVFVEFGSLLSFLPPLSSRDSSFEVDVDTPGPPPPGEDPPVLRAGVNSPSSSTDHMSSHEPHLLSRLQTVFVLCLLLAQVYCIGLHRIGPFRKMEFLPLLLTSISCASAVMLSWGQFLILLLNQ